jgi:hypothetical protein
MREKAAKIGDWEASPGQGGRIVAFDRQRRLDPHGVRLVGLVAQERGVPALLLLHSSRCTAEVAIARQVAMYLMHVVLQRDYAEVGGFFGRDRTTVAHACAQIEDRRDDPTFDAGLQRLEARLALTGARTEGASHAAG